MNGQQAGNGQQQQQQQQQQSTKHQGSDGGGHLLIPSEPTAQTGSSQWLPCSQSAYPWEPKEKSIIMQAQLLQLLPACLAQVCSPPRICVAA